MTSTSLEKLRCTDTLRLYRIDDNDEWHLERETQHKPSLWSRIKRALGLCAYPDDALTNYGISSLTYHIRDTITHVSVGESAASGTDYTLNELVSPYGSRVACSYATSCTYSLDPNYADTVTFTSIFTASSDTTIQESGCHTALTDGYMVARQVNCGWAVTNGQRYGAVWEFVTSR